MKKVIIILIVLVALAFACSFVWINLGLERVFDDKNEVVNTPSPTPSQQATTAPIPVEQNNVTYYSFLSENGASLRLNLTIDEYIDNYNQVKSSYDTYADLEATDFVYVDSSVWEDETTKIYGCPLTILGRNNSILLMLEVRETNKDIVAISLGVQNYEIYQNNTEFMEKFELQYSLLIKALGIPSAEVNEIISDMTYNESTKGNYGLYTKGLGLYYQTVSNCAYYRIVFLTEEQAQNAERLKDVIKNG